MAVDRPDDASAEAVIVWCPVDDVGAPHVAAIVTAQ
jgi:hypothetical protein